MKPDAPQKEVVKRLQPTSEVLRELFLKSGNLCAFPDCSHLIMDRDGTFIAQICHIEAAEEGGPRFNPDQSNEARRAFSNLMLMCHKHHKITDDVAEFSVKRLQEIKANHENRVTEFIEKTLLKVADQTKLNNPRPAKDCSRLNIVCDWKHNAADLEQDTKLINDLLDTLSKLPLNARQLLVVIIERATHHNHSLDIVSVAEVQYACGLDDNPMKELCLILDKYGLIQEGPSDDGQGHILLVDLDGWPVWRDFRALVKAGHATMNELVVNLNFTLLDAE